MSSARYKDIEADALYHVQRRVGDERMQQNLTEVSRRMAHTNIAQQRLARGRRNKRAAEKLERLENQRRRIPYANMNSTCSMPIDKMTKAQLLRCVINERFSYDHPLREDPARILRTEMFGNITFAQVKKMLNILTKQQLWGLLYPDFEGYGAGGQYE